jgi:hypothetical protein
MGGGASAFEFEGVSSVGSAHSLTRHARTRTYITGEHVLQASWIILKVALYAEEEEEEDQEEQEEEESAAARRRQECGAGPNDHYQHEHHQHQRRQQQQVQYRTCKR